MPPPDRPIPTVHLGHWVSARIRRLISGPQHPAEQQGFTVVQWWPNGEHHLVGFASTPRRMQQLLERRTDPLRRMHVAAAPAGSAVIAATYGQVAQHDDATCEPSTCPATSALRRNPTAR